MRLISTLLAGLSATVMFSCASSPDDRMWQTDGGLVEDHATTISNCGVGNYLFRHMKGSCATDPTSEATAATDDAGTSDTTASVDDSAATDSSIAEEQPITETRSARASGNISDQITFETDSATLTSSGRQVLDGIAQDLKGAEGRLTIEGHADHRGESEYNQKLSERRAAEVRNYLASQGVERNRISIRGYGEERPVVDPKEASPEQLSANRRVEFRNSAESE